MGCQYQHHLRILNMRPSLTFAFVGLLLPSIASAQFPDRVQPGVRVRVWLPEPFVQENSPWRRQLLRATVSEVQNDQLRLTVPGSEGTITVPRSSIRRLDVSRGQSRLWSGLERAVGFAIAGAVAAALENDPDSNEWPNYNRTWRAAEEGAKWGAAVGAVFGLVLPTERWHRVRLRSSR
jgi:hypothetical protein